jgi:deoxyribose-phosphate aldolase
MNFMLKDVSKMIDHSLLHPTFTDNELEERCKLPLDYNVATVCIKPYFVKETAKILKHSTISVFSVIGFPHGNSTIKLKARLGITDQKKDSMEDPSGY